MSHHHHLRDGRQAQHSLTCRLYCCLSPLAAAHLPGDHRQLQQLVDQAASREPPAAAARKDQLAVPAWWVPSHPCTVPQLIALPARLCQQCVGPEELQGVCEPPGRGHTMCTCVLAWRASFLPAGGAFVAGDALMYCGVYCYWMKYLAKQVCGSCRGAWAQRSFAQHVLGDCWIEQRGWSPAHAWQKSLWAARVSVWPIVQQADNSPAYVCKCRSSLLLLPWCGLCPVNPHPCSHPESPQYHPCTAAEPRTPAACIHPSAC